MNKIQVDNFEFYNEYNMIVMAQYTDNYFELAINRFKDSSRQTAFSFE